MEIKQLVVIFRRYYAIVLLGMVLCGVLALLVSVRATPTYTASTRFMISQSSASDTPLSYEMLLTNERLATTYAELLLSRPVLQNVIDTLDLDTNTTDLAERIEIFPVRDTQLLQLNVRDADSVRAATTANEIVETFNTQQAALREEQTVMVREQLERERGNLLTTIERIRSRLLAPDTQTTEVEKRQLEDTLTRSLDNATDLDQRLLQLGGSDATQLVTLQVVEAAEPPREPTAPSRMLVILLAVGLGGLLATGISLLLNYFDDTLHDTTAAEHLFGAPALAVIPHLPNGSLDGLVTISPPESRVTDAFRTLGLASYTTAAQLPNSIAITSVEPRAGKSTCCVNLAVVLAQMGKQVILVDTNYRNPVLHVLLGQHNTTGFTTLLGQSGFDFNELVRSTRWPGLNFMLSGPLLKTTSDLLNSQRFVEIAEHLHQSVDVVIFDTPALETSIDAAAVSRHCDLLILLVVLGQTRATHFQRVYSQLQATGARKIELVIVDTAQHVIHSGHPSAKIPAMVGSVWHTLRQRLRHFRWVNNRHSPNAQGSYHDD